MKKVLLDSVVNINGVDLSDHASKATVDSKKDTVDVTSFGARNKEYLLGLGDGTMAVDFFQDFDAGSVDETIAPLHFDGDPFPMYVLPDNGAVSETNPGYKMTAIAPEYTPIDGQVGAASVMSITFQNASQAGIERITDPAEIPVID